MEKEKKEIELLKDYSKMASEAGIIAPELYTKYEVKRGLRDISGKGVLAGLTEISEILSYTLQDSDLIPCEGRLFYRGIDIHDIVNGYLKDNRFGFEETAFLLMFGHLPTQTEYNDFREYLSSFYSLPDDFVRDTIMNSPSKNLMNSLASSVLFLYTYDEKADDTSIENVIRQSVSLIARFPVLAVYGFQSFDYYFNNKSLFIHPPLKELSIAENILHMLRPDSKYTRLESELLDLALVLHAEHGGGNNSTFTNHVVTSSGTDTYSAVVASLASLKGPRHGGANIKVVEMFDHMKTYVSDWTDDEEISEYLTKLLNKELFDKSGLIYGMGHAVYSLSDPRACIFRGYVKQLAEEKNLTKEFDLYSKVEELAPKVIAKERKIYKGVSANVDFYSGFVYRMLGLPDELFTPLFAIARIAGWSAHRIEELVNNGKIIRPAYKSISGHREYVPMDKR